jgi:hypothetical protein
MPLRDSMKLIGTILPRKLFRLREENPLLQPSTLLGAPEFKVRSTVSPCCSRLEALMPLILSELSRLSMEGNSYIIIFHQKYKDDIPSETTRRYPSSPQRDHMIKKSRFLLIGTFSLYPLKKSHLCQMETFL